MEDPELREKEFLDMFRQIDTDGSKSLSLGEIILFLKSITNDISEENIEKIFSNLDKSGDRSVDFEEFKVRQNTRSKCIMHAIYLFRKNCSSKKHLFSW